MAKWGRAGRAFLVLRDLAFCASADMRLDELLRTLGERLLELLGAEGVVIVLDSPPLHISVGLTRSEAELLSTKTGPFAERLDDASSDDRFGSGQTGSLLVAPLFSRGTPIGRVVASARHKRAFTHEHEEMLAFIAGSLIGDFEAARLYRQATVDPESGAGNRQLLAERLPDEVERSQRTGDRPLALVRFGIRDYPRLAQIHGHAATAKALTEMVKRTRAALRTLDYVVRLGEEAFLCVLPSAGLAGARAAAQRITSEVEGAPIELPGKARVQLRVACAAVVLEEGTGTTELLAAAELALEQAGGGARASQDPPSWQL